MLRSLKSLKPADYVNNENIIPTFCYFVHIGRGRFCREQQNQNFD